MFNRPQLIYGKGEGARVVAMKPDLFESQSKLVLRFHNQVGYNYVYHGWIIHFIEKFIEPGDV
jgi:hypothetical protein